MFPYVNTYIWDISKHTVTDQKNQDDEQISHFIYSQFLLKIRKKTPSQLDIMWAQWYLALHFKGGKSDFSSKLSVL